MRRLESLDALRGLDMLMIMGMGKVIVSLCVLCGWGADCALARQFEHVEWNGLRFEDTIFPLFLFLAGVSWPFSLAKQRANGLTTRRIVGRCARRAASLFALGLVYGGLLDGRLRMGSVLGRIGVAWMIGALLHMACRARTLVALAVGLPVAYWLLLYFVPAPDAATIAVPPDLSVVLQYGRGPFSILGNLSGWVDRHWVPGVLMPYAGIADNQSALGCIPAVATALLGILTGEFVRTTRARLSDARRLGCLFASAAALAALGWLVAHGFGEMSMPVNKKLWSASFTFAVGGYSVAVFALFHWIVDVCGCVRWTLPLRVIGMNAITIYMAQAFLPFGVVSKRLFGGLSRLLPDAAGALLLDVAYVVLCWSFLYFLYRKKVFLKV